MKQGNDFSRWIRTAARALLFLVTASLAVWAQQAQPGNSSAQRDATAAAVRDLQEQVQQLRDAVSEIRAEAAQYRAETAELRRELEQNRNQPVVAAAAAPPGAAPSAEAAIVIVATCVAR